MSIWLHSGSDTINGDSAMSPPREHFSTTIPFLQFAWDSTSLGDFKACPRKYYYTQIENWVPRKSSFHLTFGIWFHAGPEKYDKLRAEGQGHEEALRGAVRFALEGTEDWVSDDPKNVKTRESLIRSLVWYLEQYENDPLETVILPSGKPAVELSFRFNLDLGFSSGEKVLLCGHLDKVAKLSGRKYICDKKTTGSAISDWFFHGFSPHGQMSLYTLAGQIVLDEPVAGLIIDAAQIGVTFSRFQRGFVHRTPVQTDEFLRDLECILQDAERCAQRQYWPMNDASCGQYGGCKFREICGRDPSVREAFLKANFEKREWNPLSSRGED